MFVCLFVFKIYTVITGAHFSFKMSTPEARSTDFVDLTLDERFGYTRKTPYNHQVDGCQVKNEIDESVTKSNPGGSWEEIYWHKRHVEKQQELAEDLMNDEGTSVTCFLHFTHYLRL